MTLHQPVTWWRPVAAVLLGFVLNACGGGGGGSAPADPPPVVGAPVVAAPPVTPTPAVAAGKLSLVAGDPGGVGSVDGTGRWARFNGVGGIAIDAAGVMYVADSGNFTLRKVTPDGRVTTVAGSPGQQGTADGTGPAARFWAVSDVEVMPDGTLLVADGDRLRRVTAAGVVTTLPTPGMATVQKLAVDGQGVAYISTRSAVWRMPPQSTPVIHAGHPTWEGTVDGPAAQAGFNVITDMAIAKDGTIYVVQYSGPVRKISPQGLVSSISGTGGGLNGGIAVDADGRPWLANNGNMLSIIHPGGALTPAAQALRQDMTGYPGALAFNPAGELVFAGKNGLAKFTLPGQYSEIAGSVLASKAVADVVEAAQAMALDGQGGLFLAHPLPSGGLGVTKYTMAGQKAPFGASGSTVSLQSKSSNWYEVPLGLGRDASGQLLVATADVGFPLAGGLSQVEGGRIFSLSAQGVASALQAWSFGDPGLASPANLVTDRQGDAWFVDLATERLTRRAANGTLVAATGSVGQSYTRNGHIGVARAFPIVGASGQAYVSNGFERTILRLSGGELVPFIKAGASAVAVDGPAAQASFQSPGPGVVDSKGNVYVADGELIRRISADGNVTTVAGVPGRVGITAGDLPASLGLVRAVALVSDKEMLVLVDRALLRLELP